MQKNTQKQPPLITLGSRVLAVIDDSAGVQDAAVRYGGPRTKVQVEVTATGSDVSIAVRDAGPGIPAEERANIGRRFYRAPGTLAPGSGLGLSIAQRIVDIHGGAMQLDVPATGVGLQVTISLPRVADARA